MPQLSIGFGAFIILFGLATWWSTGFDPAAKTGFIVPAALGALLLIAGLVALRPGLRMHAMHAAALIALLGIGGTFSGLMKLPAYLSGAQLERPRAVVPQAVVCVSCAIFLGLCVRSFIQARRARARAEAPSS